MNVYVKMWDEGEKKYKEVHVERVTSSGGGFEPKKLWPCYNIEQVYIFESHMTLFIKHKEAR